MKNFIGLISVVLDGHMIYIGPDSMTCWSVGARRPSDQSDDIVGGWVAGYIYNCLAGYICVSRLRVPTSFPHGHLAPSEVSCLKRQTSY